MTPLDGLTYATAGSPRRAHALAAALLRAHGAREGARPDLVIDRRGGRVSLEVTGPAGEGEAAAAAGLWVAPLSVRARPQQLETASWIAALQARRRRSRRRSARSRRTSSWRACGKGWPTASIDGAPLPELAPAEARGPVGPGRSLRTQLPWLLAAAGR